MLRYALKAELRELDEASALSSAGVQDDMDTLRKELDEVRFELDHEVVCRAAESGGDRFREVMGCHLPHKRHGVLL
jgi:hypothetical protein